jgi:1-phosphofructokinase
VLSAGLNVVKVSHEELIADGLSADDSEKNLTNALLKLHDDGAEAALVSRAGMGALALINEEIYRVGTPKLTPTDGRGAGDSMTAGVAAVLARGGEMSEAVRTGAAAGALNVTRHGLGTGHLDAVQVLTERIKLTPIKKAR